MVIKYVVNMWRFEDFGMSSLRSNVLYVPIELSESTGSWVEDYPYICDSAAYYYDPATGLCTLKTTDVLTTGNDVMHFTTMATSAQSYTVRLWVKQTETQGSITELLELPSVLSLWIDNTANAFMTSWYSFSTDGFITYTMVPEIGTNIVGTWVKVALVSVANKHLRMGYVGAKQCT